jgi:hypothetical protein
MIEGDRTTGKKMKTSLKRKVTTLGDKETYSTKISAISTLRTPKNYRKSKRSWALKSRSSKNIFSNRN